MSPKVTQAWWILRIGIGAGAFLAGLDKITGVGEPRAFQLGARVRF